MKIKVSENKKYLKIKVVSSKKEMNKDDDNLSLSYMAWQSMIISGLQRYMPSVSPIIKTGIFNYKMIFKLKKD